MKILKNILGYSAGILLLGLPWFFRFLDCYGFLVSKNSIWALFSYLALIMLLSFPIEALEKFVTHALSTGLNLSKQNMMRLDRTLDFLTSLWIIHFVDEWMPHVVISTTGEIIFAVLLILFTIFLEKKNKELDESLNE
ncbi:MAG: YrvL family regulatory protein [Turicibacter sanguinis]